jgi:predicted  nucleic acid-binding Zn-ribbon protein
MSEIQNILIDLPEQIKNSELELLDLNDKLSSTKKELESIESSLMHSILNEMDEKGKPVYSNAEKRNTELAKRSAEYPDTLDLKSSIDKLERQSKELQIEIKFLRDKQANYRAIAAFSNETLVGALNS